MGLLHERAERHRLRVRWPDGYVQQLRDVAADPIVTLDEARWFTVIRGAQGRAEVHLERASLSGLASAAAVQRVQLP
jgi:hypothetical protein